jgi:hypothetical protein
LQRCRIAALSAAPAADDAECVLDGGQRQPRMRQGLLRERIVELEQLAAEFESDPT